MKPSSHTKILNKRQKNKNSRYNVVDHKIYTKYLIVIGSLIWGRKDDVGNNIFITQRCNPIPVGKDGFY